VTLGRAIARWVDVRSGSKCDLTAPKHDFRDTPRNGHRQTDAVGPFRAKTGSVYSFAQTSAVLRADKPRHRERGTSTLRASSADYL
jgi:hypothetical protein